MFCVNCGSKLNDSAICGNCGSENEERPLIEVPDIKASPNIFRDSDGVFRWIYELSLWKNPTILFTVWKVLLISAGFVGLLLFFITFSEGFFEALNTGLLVFGSTAAIVTVLMLIAYPAFCILNGGKYCVLFEMDQKGIKHEQLDRQFSKAQAIGLLTAFAGVMSGNPSVAGAGLLSATHKSVYTSFDKVRRISVQEKRSVIYIGEALEQNQVYAEVEDFRFVCDYILEHCSKKAKVTGSRRLSGR